MRTHARSRVRLVCARAPAQNGTDEAVAQIRYYLAHEEERERIVRNARSLALRRHLWRHRAATLARHVRGALRTRKARTRKEPT